MIKTVSQAINRYDHILVARDLNIDVSGSKGLNDNHFFELIDTFNLTKLVKTPTSLKTTMGTLLETGFCETGLIDCHKIIFTIFRSTFIRLLPKIIKYRNYKVFNGNIFCHELDQTLLKGEIYKSEDPHSK